MNILLHVPYTHRIYQYLRDYIHCEYLVIITPDDYRKNVHRYIDIYGFAFPNIPTTVHVNWRYPLSLGYHIRNIIRDKDLIHIGGSYGDLNVIFSKYTNSIISYECIPECIPIANQKTYSCPVKNLNQDFLSEDVEPLDADVYYSYTGHKTDVEILKKLVKYNINCTYLMGIAQDDEKLCEMLAEISYLLNDSRYPDKVDYIPIPFDESHIPVTRPTPFTRETDEKWNEWKTFDNQKGVMFVLKFELSDLV